MPPVPEQIAPGVFVAISRRDTTTSTVVCAAAGRDVVLVDPAWETDELDELAGFVAGRGGAVVAGLSTHAHHDHLLWHPAWGDVPRHGSARTVELALEHLAELVAAMGPSFPAAWGALLGRVTPLPAAFALPGSEPVVPVVHDGHAPGHTAFWLPERRVLLAGDMLSDVELPLPLAPDDLPAYLVGLDTLAPYVAQAAVLVPGHGHPTSAPMARLDADRRYLDVVRAGRAVDDPRLANDGMAEVHAQIVRLARG